MIVKSLYEEQSKKCYKLGTRLFGTVILRVLCVVLFLFAFSCIRAEAGADLSTGVIGNDFFPGIKIENGLAEAIKENTENVVRLNGVLDKTLQGAEKKKVRQCESAIDLAFKASSLRIVQEAASIIAHNNIDKNKEFIVSNINKFVSTEYYRLYSALAIYEINDVNVASRLKEEWIKEIADNLVDIIYNGQDAMTRITQVNNRLNVCVNEYSTYINNKTFNT